MNDAAVGKVYVLSGPAGVGKGTLVNALRQRHPELFVSISCTTRAPRPREVDGVDYHFISEAQFDQLLANDGLLEWALVHRKYRYGTPREPIQQAVAAGKVALLEIDLQGARQVRESMPQAVQIFLMPPDWEELVRRLRGRGTEDAADIERRLVSARTEMAAASEFDIIVTNADREEAIAELADIMGLQSDGSQSAVE